MDNLLNLSQQQIHILDIEGSILFANDAFLNAHGYQRQDLPLSIFDIDCTLNRANIVEEMSKVSDTPQVFLTQHRHRNGSTFDLEVTINKAEWQGKQVYYATAINSRLRVTDYKNKSITLFNPEERDKALNQALQKAEEISQKFQAFFATSPEAYLIFDWQTGRVIECNDSASRLLDIPKQDIIDSTPLQFSPKFQPNGERSADILKREMTKVAKHESAFFEWMHQKRNGDTFWVEIENYRGKVGDRDVAFVTWRDISQRKKLEAERQQALDDLNKKKKQQEKLFATIGHELRTPAAALAMMLEDEQPDQRLLKKTSEHLINVLDDMRVVTNPERLINGKIVNANIPAIINDALDFKQRLIQENKLKVHLQLSEYSHSTCRVNAQLLRQIVMNLIKNTLLHSGASDLWITVSSPSDQPNQFTITFDDNGCGIENQHIANLFEAFERGESQAEGTGLGLHLSREFARSQLNGDLIYQHRPWGGARFALSMQLEPAEVTPQPVELKNLAHPLKDRRILYVEDSDTLRVLTKHILAASGATVDCAIDGADAQSYLNNHHYDLIISDIFMPNMDGYQLTREIRARGLTTPIIGATAATIGNEIEQMLIAGADRVISKPFTLPQVESLFGEIMSANYSRWA